MIQMPVNCDDEGGLVQKLYQDWKTEFIYLDREKAESSHDDMAAHAHSHIKLIMRRIG